MMMQDKWIPIGEQLPAVDEDGYSNYVLVSFANYTLPEIGQYRVDDEGGAFYPGDEEKSYACWGVIVNAWMPLPERYQEVE